MQINNLIFNNKSQHGYYFSANVCYSGLRNPSYFDYMHLVFWFYFLTTFIISVWLLYTFIFISLYSEKKQPIIETRGFSRAQTGDSVTAIIPMTWSITMLMHASSSSSNFDENIDNTSFTLTVIAYQWGWNYFLPKDFLFKNKNTINYLDLFPNKKINTNLNLDFFFNIKKNNTIIDLNKLEIINNCNNINNYNWINIYLDKKNIINSNLLNINNNIINVFKTITINYNFLENLLIKTPSVSTDLDSDFIGFDRLVELSSSRNSIISQRETFELFGGLTSRLNITSGLVLPSNTPIHIVCGSKDVIHSWAVPGLFIKIDCIPGYNCHRRIFLKWQGLFWGQCMEVCGRYHHWMPILIKITHKELFLLWARSFFANVFLCYHKYIIIVKLCFIFLI